MEPSVFVMNTRGDWRVRHELPKRPRRRLVKLRAGRRKAEKMPADCIALLTVECLWTRPWFTSGVALFVWQY